MSVIFRIGGIAAACIALSVWTSSAAELSRYREFDLGSSVATVTAVTGSTGRDLKTLHSKPALLQDVAWQPRYMSGAPVADRNSINEVMFSFVDDRLFRMSVAYDRSRTAGLTDADMIAALTEVYGVPASSGAPSRAESQTADGVAVLAEWRDTNVHVALRRVHYNDSFSLVVTSLPLEAIARQARATARTIDAREAPAREAALAKKRADDQRHAEEQVRATNRKVFRP
jgi:hypothetical protein